MTKVINRSWSDITLENLPPEDSLFGCLILILRYYDDQVTMSSPQNFSTLNGKKLTLSLFKKTALKAALHAEIKSLNPEDLDEQRTPLVLLKRDGSAVLLICNDKNKKTILDPQNPLFSVNLKDISQELNGDVISIVPQEEFQKNSVTQHKNWFWKVLFKSKLLYIEVLLASIFINIFALAVPLFTMNVYDRVVPHNATETMWVLAIGVALIFIIDALLKNLRTYFIDIANKNTDCELSSVIFEQIIGLEMNSRPRSVGSLVNTVQSFETFRDFITSSTMTVLIDLPFIIFFLYVIYLIGGYLVWIGFIVIPIICITGVLIQRPLIDLTQKSFQHASDKQNTLLESLSAVESIKLMGAESVMQSKWEKVIDETAKNGMKLRFITNFSANFTNLIIQAATVFMLIAGIYMITHNQLTTGGLVACTILLGRSLAPTAQISSLFNRYFQSVSALNSLDKIMQLDTDFHVKENTSVNSSFQKLIEFKNVSFKYQHEETDALSQINLTIHKGDRIAIIGRSGSGKSTIGKLLLKLYAPREGTILVDSADYQKINSDHWREHIGYIPQDIVLFYGSIRDNICAGATYVPDSVIIEAAELSGVTKFTQHHHLGLNRQVGEKGGQLSGGQRQAVAIARALLMKPSFLIFDEPTSAMDDASEKLFKKQINEYLNTEGTLILVTHKLSMLELVNRVIVIDEGTVIADGTYTPEH